jgi:prolyl 4-hydroxylase
MSQASQAAVSALETGQHANAIAIATKAAALHDVDAIALLAHWHLVGHVIARDLGRARELLHRAAQLGDVTSALTQVAFAANGTGGTADWAHALSLLRQAGERWGGEAQMHLNLLAAMDIDAHGMPSRLPTPKILSEAPLVRLWPGLLSKEECTHVATSVLDLLEPSMVADPRTGRQMAHPIRRSSAAVISPTRETLPIQAIQRRIAAATGTLVSQGEPLSVLHYAPGQEYLAHMDTLPNEANQRSITALIYLNEGYVGGETCFPATGLRVAGKLGDVLAFSNVKPDGSPDPASRHAGLPVQRGTKWLATRWIRQQPLDLWGQGR